MHPKTVIMMGPQGSGKGTQLARLEETLHARGLVARLETGKAFRTLMEEEGYTAQLVRESMERGEIQPLFLSITLWGNLLKERMQKDTHLLLDGFPRRVQEADVLDTAMRFYDRGRIDVVVLNLSEDVAIERLQKRGRVDDTPDGIRERLSWFQETVVPAIDWYRSQEDYVVHDIDADQTIDEVAHDIAKAISLK